MSRIINDLVSDWNGYTEEYPNWKNTAIQSMLIGFGLSCLVLLFTVVICSQL